MAANPIYKNLADLIHYIRRDAPSIALECLADEIAEQAREINEPWAYSVSAAANLLVLAAVTDSGDAYDAYDAAHDALKAPSEGDPGRDAAAPASAGNRSRC